MRAFRILATALFVLCIPVALITSTIRFVVNEQRVYRYAIDQFGGVETTGISRAELLRASAELREYFNNDAELVDIRVMRGGTQVPLFNPREVAHLKDVKDRFRAVNRAQEFSVLYSVGFVAIVVLWAREMDIRGLAVRVAGGSLIALAAVGAAAAVGLAGFESAWEDFHRIMFSNDFWLLNPLTDHLIQMFPPAFWESIVFFIGLMVAAEAALLLLLAGIYLGASRHQEQASALAPYYVG